MFMFSFIFAGSNGAHTRPCTTRGRVRYPFPCSVKQNIDCTVTIDQRIEGHPKHYLLRTCCYVTLFGTSSLVGKIFGASLAFGQNS